MSTCPTTKTVSGTHAVPVLSSASGSDDELIVVLDSDAPLYEVPAIVVIQLSLRVSPLYVQRPIPTLPQTVTEPYITVYLLLLFDLTALHVAVILMRRRAAAG